jgi:outer membrane receptor protein involved in Fe transport
MALFAWSLAGVSQLAFEAPARASTPSISIPAGPLADSIRRLSDLTGVSVGFAGRLPSLSTHEVRRAHSPAEALSRMLAGSGYRAVATGPLSFRIEYAAPTSPAALPVQKSRPPEAPQPEIVVTALKRAKPLSTLPATARVIRGQDLRSANGIAGSDAIGREVPSLTVSSVGPGLNRLFLRGIGDGPLNGFNQGSVAVMLDDARLNYDAPDPDWALVDIDQVEILEGPQGPLYGTGALGGIVKLSTKRPDLSRASIELAAGLSFTEESGISNNQSAILNLPLDSGRLAVRAIAYRASQDGWIDNIGGSSNSNREQLAGGRATVRWEPSPQWTVDLTGAIQSRNARDSQYVDGDFGPLERPNRLREPKDLDASAIMMTVKGPVGKLEFTSITSLSRQGAAATYDATPLAETLGTNGTTTVRDDRNYHLFDQEVRIQNPHAGRIEWLAGLSLVHASTDASISAEDSTSTVPLLTLKRSVDEAAAFAEASAKIAPHLTVGGGARVFTVGTDEEGQEPQASVTHNRRTVRAAGDANLAWTPATGTTIFLRVSTGYRPGGINIQPDATQRTYEADELATAEIGLRTKIWDAASIDATLYAAQWQHVQTDELLSNGLIATRNAGNARNFGVEGNVHWTIAPQFILTGGLMFQSARLESVSPASEVDDPRLPAVPNFAARVKLERGFHWGSWAGLAGLGLRYTGATHLSFDPTLDRRTGSYATGDASLSLSRDGWTATLVGENLTNSSEDTFAFGNPYRVRAEPQRTPMKPRTIGVSVSRTF